MWNSQVLGNRLWQEGRFVHQLYRRAWCQHNWQEKLEIKLRNGDSTEGLAVSPLQVT